MRLIGAFFALALLLAALAPSSAIAPAFAAAAKVEAPTVSKENRAKGMAAAPGIITAASLDCELADARFIGQSKDPKAKTTSEFYEIACTGNEGLVVDQETGVEPKVFTCAETAAPDKTGKPNSLMCLLPGNIDPKAGLLPYIQKSGVTCAPTQFRALGHSNTTTVFELKCESGDGFVLQTSAPPSLKKPSSVEPCIAYDPGMNVHCELTDRAAQLALVDRLVTQSGKACTVKDRRFIGASTTSGSLFYEVACQDGKGYVIQATTSGGYQRVIDCAAAEGIGGGCTLTNARQAMTEQLGLYTQLAHKAGFNCAVSKYAPLPVSASGQDVVELACSNRPDGAIAVFTAAGPGSAIYDCAHSELKSYRCSFTPAAAAYPKLTADLHTLGKTSCAVSSERIVGVSAEQQGYIEVACSDGLPGFMIQYTMNPLAPKEAIACSEAQRIGGGCTLPTNAKRG